MQVTVRSGDSLWKYSILFGVPFRLIVDSNPGIEPEALYIGQAVQIPGFQWVEYRIASGDSLWRIATRNGISAELLLQTNPGLESNNLQVGDTIRIPRRVMELVTNPQRNYNVAALEEDLGRLLDVYPFLRRSSIGNSVMGKPLTEIRIGSGDRIIHANGSIHANEWITTPVLVQFLNEYAMSVTNSMDWQGTAMYAPYLAVTLSVVPMLNPDGVDLVVGGLPEAEPVRSEVLAINEGSSDFSGWKANIRGVDLNKQFPALWERDAAIGPQSPAPRDYSGAAPLTEPEVQALAELTRRDSFLRVLAFHTQGEVFFWGFEGLEPPESAALAAAFAEASGYESIRNVDSTAGYKDWFIQDWRRPGFTIELGKGTNPLPLEQYGQIYDAASSIIRVAITR
ncbi:M14 family metallopeptidase [Paenibacillus sp. NPDC057967]|uniref:M14 family metallopeptidase n=1 Tax=Paenibacillus sp. NPDC057967 TaxID=3346293 RepID=UPI0036DE3B38